MANKIIHKHSSVLNNGMAKLPTAEQLEYGEIAINYAPNNETISFKNDNDEIVSLRINEVSELKTIVKENEEVTSSALNYLNDNKQNLIDDLETIRQGAASGNTSVQNIQINGEIKTPSEGLIDLGTGYTKNSELESLYSSVSGLTTEVSGLTNTVSGLTEDVSGLTDDLSELTTDVSGLTEEVSGLTNTITELSGIVEENEIVAAKALTDISEKVNELTNNTSDLTEIVNNISGITNNITTLTESVSGLTDNVATLTDTVNGLTETVITWDYTSNMNNFTTTGTYKITGERTNTQDSLPIYNTGIIEAKLQVFAADNCVSQILTLLNVGGGDTNIYTRTKQNGEWGQWGKLQSNIEVGAIGVGQTKTFNDFTDNGMYSGVNLYWVGDGTYNAETFVLIVVNGYLYGAGITQLKYSIKQDGSVNIQTRKKISSEWTEWLYVNRTNEIVNENENIIAYIKPNIYYKFPNARVMEINFDSNDDYLFNNIGFKNYMFEFTTTNTIGEFSFPSSIKWANGNAPLIETNKTYQVSVINNLGVFSTF